MVVQGLVGLVVFASITALCFRHPPAGRWVVGLFFAAMALVNAALAVVAPARFVELAANAPWGWYRWLGSALVQPAPAVFGAAMAAAELALAVLVLSRGQAARLGLYGMALFLVAITPLGLYTLPVLVLAVGVLRLAAQPWPHPAFSRAPALPHGRP